MFTVVITEKGGAQRRMDFDKNEVTIGRVQGNDIILPKGNVSKRHSRIVLKDSRFIVVDLKSTNGTYVNGRKITSPLVVKPGDKIYIGDFILTLEEAQQAYEEPAASAPPPAPEPPQPQMQAPVAPAPQPPAPQAHAQPQPQPQPPVRRRSAGAPPPLRAPSAPQQRQSAPPPLPAREAAQAERFPLDEEPSEDSPAPRPRVSPARPQRTPSSTGRQERPPAPIPARRSGGTGEVDPGLRSLMIRLAQEFDVDNADPSALHDASRWNLAQSVIDGAIGELQDQGQIGPNADREGLAGAALREAVGLGALEPLLSDDSVREIVVEGPTKIVADFGRGLEPVDASFSSVDALSTIAKRLIAQAGERIDPGRAIYETSLPYGPHVTVVLPPVAVRGPVIEIRRMAQSPTADKLAELGWMSTEMLDLLREAVLARRNVLVAGAVGSGVTTLLGALAGLTGEHERLVTVEDLPDLNISRDHVITLGGSSANGALKFRDVLRQASKLRADRLVVDDVRGDECFDVLATVAARRPGNFIGVHAAQGRDAVAHVVKLAKQANGQAEVGDLVTQAVQLVVQLECGADGSRRVTRVAEVTGAEGDSVQAKDLFVYDGSFNRVG